MLWLFAFAIFLSAALLFLVQPLAAKLLLPLLGGSPAVWNTCMVFFQAMLLLGYLYAFLLTKLRTTSRQLALHALFVLAAGASLPIALPIVNVQSVTGNPILWVLYLLGMTAAAPFFVVATTGPLLQKWFSRTDHPSAKDPYFLYAASNAGSIVGLLAYPLGLEPTFTLSGQGWAWTVGYALLGPLLVLCGVVAIRRGRREGEAQPGPGPGTKASKSAALSPSNLSSAVAAPSPAWSRRLLWIALAAVPSSLSIGVTQTITTDVAAVPLLWVIPLLLYLLTFILAFQQTIPISSRVAGRFLPIAVVAVLVATVAVARHPLFVIAGLHLALLFLAALMCHRRLAETRPDPAHLTEFYIWIAVGGVLGGSLNSLVAPVLFKSILEYPIAIAAACFLRPQLMDERAGAHLHRWWRYAITVCFAVGLATLVVLVDYLTRGRNFAGLEDRLFKAGIPAIILFLSLGWGGSARFAAGALAVLLVAIPLNRSQAGFLLYVSRSFFGINEVFSDTIGQRHRLTHGTTTHGIQIREPAEMRAVPTTYYHRSGPIGDVFDVMSKDPARQSLLQYVLCIGMGTGTMAAYAQPGQQFAFIEIDEAVTRIAQTDQLFTYINDARRRGAIIDILLGDGRKVMELLEEGTPKFGVIVVDAFSSDAIPVHLITKEAIEIYRARLHQDGLLAVHISNRYFDLQPVLASIADEIGMTAITCYDAIEEEPGNSAGEAKFASVWVVLMNDKRSAEGFANRLNRWRFITNPQPRVLWTDSYSNIISVLTGQ